jgi:hypothetical protein
MGSSNNDAGFFRYSINTYIQKASNYYTIEKNSTIYYGFNHRESCLFGIRLEKQIVEIPSDRAMPHLMARLYK